MAAQLNRRHRKLLVSNDGPKLGLVGGARARETVAAQGDATRERGRRSLRSCGSGRGGSVMGGGSDLHDRRWSRRSVPAHGEEERPRWRRLEHARGSDADLGEEA